MANYGEILSNIAIGAGQSIRRNAGDTAFEAYTPSGAAITIQEEDGSPTGTLSTLRVTNGTLTDNGGGSFSLAIGGSSNEFADNGHRRTCSPSAEPYAPR